MGCEPVEARMRSVHIVVDPPVFNDVAGVSVTAEQMFVEAFVPKPAVEALDKTILHRFSRRDVVPIDAAVLLPFKHGV